MTMVRQRLGARDVCQVNKERRLCPFLGWPPSWLGVSRYNLSLNSTLQGYVPSDCCLPFQLPLTLSMPRGSNSSLAASVQILAL